MTYTVDVMVGRMGIRSDIELVLSYTQCLWHHREWIWCHKHSECHDIQTVVWCHQEWMWYHIQCLWCSTCSGCDLIYTQAVISSIKWVWLQRYSRCVVGYSGCVVIHTQCEMSYTLVSCPIYSGYDVTSRVYGICYKVRVISWIEWMWCHEYSLVMSYSVGVMSYSFHMMSYIQYIWCHT